MKSSYQSRALKTWGLLMPYLKNCRTVDRYANAVKKFNEEHHNYNIKFTHGATRVCFICADYVIKRDYGNGKRDWGGCEDELNRYEEARQDGYDYLLCPIEEIAHNAYVMPRAKTEHSFWSAKYLSRFNRNLTRDERAYIYDNIHDIHSNNVGLYKGRVVVIDYACG